jgi:DNA-binding transcriptional LysR family regulator
MQPDFNRLRVFYFVYQNKSVAGAARDLHVTQSAVSQHLHKLEKEIHFKLFTRLPKRLLPTPAAEKLFGILQPFIDNLTSGLREIDQARRHPSGLLRIGAPAQFGENTLPGIIAGFQRRCPDVRFQLELGHPTLLLPMVRDGTIDVAFADIFADDRYATEAMSLFAIQHVVDEALVLVGSAAYCAENRLDRPTAGNLAKQRYIAYREHAPAIRSWFKHHFNTSAMPLSIVLTVESVRAVVQAVRQGMGLGIIPSHVITEELASGELMQVRTAKKALINRIALVQLQDKVPAAAEKEFVAYFKNHWR